MGLQSGSDRVCREVYQRKSLPSDFMKSARLIKEAGIAAYYDVIMDNPFKATTRLATAEAILDIPDPFTYISTRLLSILAPSCITGFCASFRNSPKKLSEGLPSV